MHEMDSDEPVPDETVHDPTREALIPMDKKRLVTHLLWITPVAGFISVVITVAVWLSTQFSGSPDSTGLTAQYGLAVVVFAVPALWLLWTIVRHKTRFADAPGTRTTAAIVAVVFLVLGCLVSVPPLIREATFTIRAATELAIARQEPPSAAETAYTPGDLERETQDLIEETMNGLPQTYEVLWVQPETCSLSNRAEGIQYDASVTVDLDIQSPTSWEDFRQPVIENWERIGHSVELGTDPRSDPHISDGPFESVDAIEQGPWARIEIDTVCVEGSMPE
jgi:hypothetical protein